jgi:AIR synthase-related protein
MLDTVALDHIAATLRASRGIAAKRDIAAAVARLGVSGEVVVPVGDDCAAIPDRDGFLLLAIEGFMNEFVSSDPWFAGWCGVMVNVSDVAAMGGRPLAVVDAVWAASEADADPVLAGMRDASCAYGVPVVGGHTNTHTDRGQLSVAILGRATRLLTSFDARPGDRLVAAIDLRGRYREPFSNWEAATDAPVARLRGDIEVLPAIAEAELACAGKDISQGGIIGTTMMLTECSGVAATIDVAAIPRPDGVALERWLQTFPSYGYVLSVAPANVAAVIDRFASRGIAVAEIGTIAAGTRVAVTDGRATETVWDFAREALIGCGQSQFGQSQVGQSQVGQSQVDKTEVFA